MRHFHNAAAVTMVATPLAAAGACGARLHTSSAPGPAASTPNSFIRTRPATLDLPRPIFMTVGRVAVEKNLEAFLSLDLPGTKIIVGDGPQRAELEQRFRSRNSSARRRAKN